MNSSRRIGSILLFGSVLNACAAHPVVHDFTGYYAPELVRKARCEARQAIADKIAAWLIGNDDDPYGVEISKKIRDRKIRLSTIEWKKLDPRDYAYLEYFFPTAIAFNFNLDITEANDASVDLNFLAAITKGTVSVPIKTGLNRSRNNVQTFTIADKWGYLLKDLPEYYCDQNEVDPEFFSSRSKYVYPIAGKIGIDAMVDDFVDLTLFGALAGEKGESKPAMAYAQQFTTKIYGNVTPKITVVSSSSLKDGTLGLSNYREDKHKIIVGFSLAVSPQFEREEEKVGTYVNVEGDATTRRAIGAIDQLIRRTERSFVLVE
ncbi:hypothetical protein NKI50_27525 [Mesorhizobium sp. M0563]|uniref:hypothetical protein n=1 Tax=Mesorhizobium sp. M0563 TaxID=2956959 RepID=UPI00333C58C2